MHRSERSAKTFVCCEMTTQPQCLRLRSGRLVHRSQCNTIKSFRLGYFRRPTRARTTTASERLAQRAKAAASDVLAMHQSEQCPACDRIFNNRGKKLTWILVCIRQGCCILRCGGESKPTISGATSRLAPSITRSGLASVLSKAGLR